MIEQFDFDPAHFFSVPGLTWCAAIKYTKASLELLTDKEQLLFVEKGIRNGITCVMERYARLRRYDRLTIQRCQHLMRLKIPHILHIWMSTFYIDARCVKIFHMDFLNGLMSPCLKILCQK